MDRSGTSTSPLAIALAWAVVALPLGWGVYQSVVKSLPLFGVEAKAPPGPVGGAR
jgi:hypothetical protein